MKTRMIQLLSVVTVLAAILAPAEAAGAASKATNCVVYVVDQLESGQYVLSDEQCFATFADAMSAVGLGSGVTSVAAATVAMSALSSTLAVHYDGANYTGASTSVVGANCLGGWLNVAAAWNDRISSTFSNFCGRVRHYVDINLGGTYQDTLPSGNLGAALNNQVSSIQYLN